MNEPTIIIRDNTDALALEIIGILSHILDESKDQPIHIALSGGNTPQKIFRYFSDHLPGHIPLHRIHFWWGDERCVPPDNDESNYKWAWELWLGKTHVPRVNIHRIRGENYPEGEAERYAEEITQYLKRDNGLPRFDFIWLGLGEDGHTASIFPDQKHLLYSDELCAVASHPVSGQKRITLTGSVLNHAKLICFIATGASKAKVVYEIIRNKNEELPAAHIHPPETIWFLDPPAAQEFLLQKPES
ncbi:MAG TPA: 6-phosphogluconolactonase [Prolixibacteraceae bacterium]|nr:6-phosphogluconolactonase [Prolixibacteraceae bacterium]